MLPELEQVPNIYAEGVRQLLNRPDARIGGPEKLVSRLPGGGRLDPHLLRQFFERHARLLEQLPGIAKDRLGQNRLHAWSIFPAIRHVKRRSRTFCSFERLCTILTRCTILRRVAHF